MAEKSQTAPDGNRVLQAGHRQSRNFYESDKLLQDYLSKQLDADALAFLEPLLHDLGAKAATGMNPLSLAADQNPPRLQKRNVWGETVNEIQFHPAYWELMQVAVDSQMMRLKWDPSLRERFRGQRHRMGFALGMLYAMSESGQYCPLCMTDGVAHLIDQFAGNDDRDRLLPHIYSVRAADFYTGAMFLTEKAGGSDVGANLTIAKPIGDGYYTLHGEKWFCSNVNAQIIFALARTDAAVPGTRGLSIFLIERTMPDGSSNPIDIVRLKDKLGTRSMASGECILDGTVGKLVGPEFQGFRVMAEMINLSRMYNSVAAVAGGRRALIEAWQFLNFRNTFGKTAVAHALVRDKLWELGAMQHGSFLLLWRAIEAMDRAEAGDKREAELLRLLTPMVKRHTAKTAVYICRESMELMGGLGYIEDTVVPKTLRDVLVLPIWEGAGNIMVLDMLRASSKSGGLAILFAEIEEICKDERKLVGGILLRKLELEKRFGELPMLEQDIMEVEAKKLFLALTQLYLEVLALDAHQRHQRPGADLTFVWLGDQGRNGTYLQKPLTQGDLESLIAWDF